MDNRTLDRQRIADRLAELAGVAVSILEASTVADLILGRAKAEPRMPTRFVMVAINRQAHEWAQFIHNPTKIPE